MKAMYYSRFTKTNTIQNRLKTIIRSNQLIVLISIFIFVVMILSFSIISMQVNAEKSVSSEKLIKSVKVEKGDSLWSIASENITEDYKDINAYIYEIMKCNSLTTDVIHEGNYIIVPYYKNTDNRY